jgi:hypothetical protein
VTTVPTLRVVSRTDTSAQLEQLGVADLPAEVQPTPVDIASMVREGLLAMSVAAGMAVMQTIFDAEVTPACGSKGRHDADRTTSRHGSERGSVVLGGRRVPVTRPVPTGRIQTKPVRPTRPTRRRRRFPALHSLRSAPSTSHHQPSDDHLHRVHRIGNAVLNLTNSLLVLWARGLIIERDPIDVVLSTWPHGDYRLSDKKLIPQEHCEPIQPDRTLLRIRGERQERGTAWTR